MSLARGLFGALGRNKAPKPRKGSRRGPALLAVLGGLGAAGAAAFKRRQTSMGSQPQASESGPEVGRATQTPPAA